MIYLPQVGRRR